MTTATVALVPRRWRRLPIRSARLRLTLLYSGMFLALGTALIIVIYIVGSSGGVTGSVSFAVPSPGIPGLRGIHEAVGLQHNSDVNRLIVGAWVTLVVTAGASALLGWFVAGRVLRPLRDMTLAARSISAGNLHERIALAGREDEFKQLGDTIDDLLARLEASFTAQRRFVANAAHELRTPLTVERTLLQVALSDPEASTASLRATCEELLESGRDHERLLEALLTLATSERGLEARAPVDLAQAVETVLLRSRPETERTSLELGSRLDTAWTYGNQALIERLVANLLDNAASYNVPGGRIDIRTASVGGRAMLTIANTGPEIHAEDIERLFEPFRRFAGGRGNADLHHGLGLSIVRAVAAAHEATVTARPEPGGGLAITVSFPG